jgi:hypothetical protein
VAASNSATWRAALLLAHTKLVSLTLSTPSTHPSVCNLLTQAHIDVYAKGKTQTQVLDFLKIGDE